MVVKGSKRNNNKWKKTRLWK